MSEIVYSFTYRILTLVLVFILLGACSHTTLTKHQVYLPTIACHQPKPLEQFVEDLPSIMEAKTEGELIGLLRINILLFQNQIILWEIYKNCVENTLKTLQE